MLAILLVLLLTVSTASATDNATCDVVSAEETTDEVVIVEDNQEILKENDVGTFTDLAREIRLAKNELNLTRNYVYIESDDSDYKNGITINKKIIINGGGFTINGNNQARIFNIKYTNVILNKICFINSHSESLAGSIYWAGNNCVLANCSFMNTYCESSGGFIYWVGNNCVLANCSFMNAHTESAGGFIYLKGNNSVLTNCSFVNSHNSQGGAVYWSANNGILANCSFTNCSSYNYGGAVEWNGKNGVLANCSFVDCSANGYTSDGGAVEWHGKNGVLANCSFVDCTSSGIGGAVDWYETADNGTLYNCNFTDCHSHEGGAIYWSSDMGNISGCNFINCHGLNGGAIRCYSNNSALTNSNFINCHINGCGGAVDWFSFNSTISNCNFLNCSTLYEGGAVYWHFTDNGILTNCSFVNCYSNYDDGGAVYWDQHSNNGVLANCSFTNCFAENGGAVCWLSNNGRVFKSIFINCSANKYGGGLYFAGTNCSLIDPIFEGNIAQNGSDWYSLKNLKILKSTILSASNVVTTYNGGGKLIATLKDNEGNPINGARVKMVLGRLTKTLTTDANGQVLFSTDGLAPNTYTATIIFDGNYFYDKSTAFATVVVNKDHAKVYLRNALYFVLQTKYVTVTLWDSTNNPIAGKTVHITLNEYNLTYSGVTNNNGDASIRVGVGFGVHSATVRFDGDDFYNASERTGSIRVIKETPSVMVRGADTQFKVSTNPKVVKVYLWDRTSKPLPVGSKIFIKINGQMFSGTTDSEGIAHVQININRVGTFDAQVTYAGNSAYNAVTKNIKISVKRR